MPKLRNSANICQSCKGGQSGPFLRHSYLLTWLLGWYTSAKVMAWYLRINDATE